MSDADTAVSKLRLEVESREVDKAGTSLNTMAAAGWLAVGAVTAIASAVAAASYKMYEGAAASSKLKSEIASVGVESGKVQKAFNDLLMISPNFNGGIQAATKSFRDLVANGLNPSEAALMAYQDHAAHYGKDLDDYVKKLVAVTNGELNAMKEFGIQVVQQNDKLVVSFQGQKTKIENSTTALEKYLMTLSKTKFAGAQALKDANVKEILGDIIEQWDLLWINLGNQTGYDNTLVKYFSMALAEAQKFNDFIASGEMEHDLLALGNALRPLKDIAEDVFTGVTNIFIRESTIQKEEAKKATDDFHSFWLDMPAGAKAAVDRMIENIAYFVTNIRAMWKHAGDVISIEMAAWVTKAEVTGKSIFNALKDPFNASEHLDAGDKQIEAVTAATEEAKKKAMELMDLRLALLRKHHEEANKDITDERNKTIQSIEDEFALAEKKREEYRKKQASGTALNDFAPDKGRKIESASNHRGKSAEEKEYEQLVASLHNQEEKVRASYEKRLGLIKKYTEEGSVEQANMSSKLVEQTANELVQVTMLRNNDLGGYFKSLKDAEQLLEDSYQERRRIILNTTGLTEKERSAMLSQAENTNIEQQRNLLAKRNTAALKGVQDFLHNLASIGAAFGEKGFKIAKAAAIASATIDMYQSAVGAYSAVARIPYIGPYVAPVAAAAAVAAGAANIANIKSQSYSGAYDLGGSIPSGKWGIVGERGPEMVQGPAIVTGRNTTAGNGSLNTSGPQVVVQVYNLPGQTASVSETTGATGERQLQVIIQRVEEKLTGDVKAGTGSMVPALARQFGLTRRSV